MKRLPLKKLKSGDTYFENWPASVKWNVSQVQSWKTSELRVVLGAVDGLRYVDQREGGIDQERLERQWVDNIKAALAYPEKMSPGEDAQRLKTQLVYNFSIKSH